MLALTQNPQLNHMVFERDEVFPVRFMGPIPDEDVYIPSRLLRQPRFYHCQILAKMSVVRIGMCSTLERSDGGSNGSGVHV